MQNNKKAKYLGLKKSMILRLISFLCILMVVLGCNHRESIVPEELKTLRIERVYDRNSFCILKQPEELEEIRSILNRAVRNTVLFQGDLRLIFNENGDRKVMIVSKDNYARMQGTYKLPRGSFDKLQKMVVECGETNYTNSAIIIRTYSCLKA